jgi:predicted aspartyl protease
MRVMAMGLRWRSVTLSVIATVLLAGASSRALPEDSPPGQATAPTPLTAVSPLVEEVLVTAPEPRYVAPTTRDRIGRIWAPVMINGRGPYRLVLDTGASRSAITGAVVDELALPIQADTVRLQGATGSAVVSAVRVKTLEIGELLIENTIMPIVVDAFGGAQGVLGGEGLEGKRIVIEFHRDRIDIARSHRQLAPQGFSVVPFKYRPAQGMRVFAMVGSIKVIALIDTGAQVTVGNRALRAALAKRRSGQDESGLEIVGVTEDVQQATSVRIPSMVAGELIVRNAQILFSDLYIFEHWKLESKPAVLIGMDVLGILDTLVIDYSLGELHIRTRR